MMSQGQLPSFELDTSKPIHKRAVRYLTTMDREQFPTYGDAIVTAVVDYFERYYGTQEQTSSQGQAGYQQDPGYYEARSESSDYVSGKSEISEEMIERAVERALERVLPDVLARYLDESMLMSDDADDMDPEMLEALENDIDWGFLGGE